MSRHRVIRAAFLISMTVVFASTVLAGVATFTYTVFGVSGSPSVYNIQGLTYVNFGPGNPSASGQTQGRNISGPLLILEKVVLKVRMWHAQNQPGGGTPLCTRVSVSGTCEGVDCYWTDPVTGIPHFNYTDVIRLEYAPSSSGPSYIASKHKLVDSRAWNYTVNPPTPPGPFYTRDVSTAFTQAELKDQFKNGSVYTLPIPPNPQCVWPGGSPPPPDPDDD